MNEEFITECEECGADIAKTQAYCGKCGNEIDSEGVPGCGHCGGTVWSTDRYCRHCGAGLCVCKAEAVAHLLNAIKAKGHEF